MGAQSPWSRGLVVSWHVGSSRTRDGTSISSTGRQILTTGPPGFREHSVS